MYRDHPRTRGVYPQRASRSSTGRGSSPHTRGLHLEREYDLLAEGIIPAHAGFTRNGVGKGVVEVDHPRTRGVYDDVATLPLEDRGSSPHTRGLLLHEPVRAAHGRIIPAHAGFTVASALRRCRRRDHPRTRGVYRPSSSSPHQGAGSSPHTRGLRMRCA